MAAQLEEPGQGIVNCVLMHAAAWPGLAWPPHASTQITRRLRSSAVAGVTGFAVDGASARRHSGLARRQGNGAWPHRCHLRAARPAQ
ncbi:hypothetical protein IA54_013845 [Xanthomonas phaseoli pv. syngonii LMG 9055]|uniref:Uncharacterized protein n=1 Tax=Xanthomonas phaseoli pv. syngonii LMG 9055 TaxID=1437878 RepID=A0A1V9GS40_9XANT|nr:hypothetical protein IA54_013845 [Xanthomonas phaseoli pv. syngonii LMG 9055]